MAKQKAPHIALSYSRLSTYEQCPHKFYSQYIAKNYPDDGGNIHFIKGKKKHTQLENYIKCKNDPTMMPMKYDGDVLEATKIVDNLRLAGFELTAEQQLSVSLKWTPLSWFDKATMYRAICDFIAVRDIEAVLGDWKTGKYRDYDGKDTGQLHLAAAVVFAHKPEIQKIKTAYFYIEQKQTVIRQFTREMFNENLRTPFNEAFKTVNEDAGFDAKRNQYCNWCLIKDTTCPLFGKPAQDIPH